MRIEWAGNALDTKSASFGAKEPHTKYQDAEIVLAEPLDGSTKLTNTNVDRKVVLVEHSNVTCAEKARNAQNAGAIAVIIYNNQNGGPMEMGGDDSESIMIPVVSISHFDGTQLAAAIKAGTTSISLNGAVVHLNCDAFMLSNRAFLLHHLCVCQVRCFASVLWPL